MNEPFQAIFEAGVLKPLVPLPFGEHSLNNQLAELAKMNFDIQSLIPRQRTGLQEPRFKLRRGENEIALEDLRGLSAAVRSAGEKGDSS